MDRDEQIEQMAEAYQAQLPDLSDEKLLNRQVVTGEMVRSIPLVAVLTGIALRRGPQVAKKASTASGRQACCVNTPS
jgi:hypothetical protein